MFHAINRVIFFFYHTMSSKLKNVIPPKSPTPGYIFPVYVRCCDEQDV